MHQSSLLLTLVTHLTPLRSTVDRRPVQLPTWSLRPNGPSYAGQVAARSSRCSPTRGPDAPADGEWGSLPGAAILVLARSAPPRPSEPGCARPGRIRTRACR